MKSGDPSLRIKSEEVDAAFGKDKPRKPGTFGTSVRGGEAMVIP